MQQLTVKNNIFHPLLTGHRKQDSSHITPVEWGSWLCAIGGKEKTKGKLMVQRWGWKEDSDCSRIMKAIRKQMDKRHRQGRMAAGRGPWGSWNLPIPQLLKFGLMGFGNATNTWSSKFWVDVLNTKGGEGQSQKPSAEPTTPLRICVWHADRSRCFSRLYGRLQMCNEKLIAVQNTNDAKRAYEEDLESSRIRNKNMHLFFKEQSITCNQIKQSMLPPKLSQHLCNF